VNDFQPLLDVQEILKELKAPWFIAGGWAIDLALGRKTRDHKDIDICVFYKDAEHIFNYFCDWDKQLVIPNSSDRILIDDWKLLSPPNHELHIYKDNFELELLFNKLADDKVLFRRDESIKISLSEFYGTRFGIPYVNSKWILLYKAKYIKPLDDEDFKNILPLLSTVEKDWLKSKLMILKSNCDWISLL
jgi:hypothetical protein